jgi:hypothetical protein
LSVVVIAYRRGETLREFVDSLVYLLDREEREWELVLVANHFSNEGDKTNNVLMKVSAPSSTFKALLPRLGKIIEVE